MVFAVYRPIALPAEEAPIANAVFRWKYCETTVGAGTYRQPKPKPMARAWARKTCQYWEQRLVMKIPTAVRVDPRASEDLR